MGISEWILNDMIKKIKVDEVDISYLKDLAKFKDQSLLTSWVS